MAKALTYKEFEEYSKVHYNKGGDTYYECWDERTFDEYVKMFGPITKSAALQMYRTEYSIQKEYRAMAKW